MLASGWNGQHLCDVREKMRCGDLDPVEVTQETLTRSHHAQVCLNAFSTIADKEALADAAMSAARMAQHRDGRLEGVPIAIKDMIDTRGIETRYGSAAYLENVPAEDADLVTALRAAGAVIIGKSATHEFGWGVTTSSPVFGNTLNPYDHLRIPGGSSGGAAAAVASGAVPASLATDTGGSVRIPAALCGTVGFKPSYGVLSTNGIFPLAPSLDHPGIIGNSLDTTVLIADALGIGVDPSVRKPRIGVVWAIPPVVPDEAVASAFGDAVTQLRSVFTVIDVDAARLFDQAFAAFATTVLAEAAIAHFSRHDAATIKERYTAETQERLEASRTVTIADYAAAQAVTMKLKSQLSEAMAALDCLILPTCPCVAPLVGRSQIRIGGWEGSVREGLMTYTAPFNLAGCPALTMPIQKSGELPIGLQVVGRRGRDALLLADSIAIAQTLTPELHG
jgi:aspartyl-tRNA(Asn)/glutamyl-tRNA(Gln) amidotransferase subunit A